MNPLTILEIVTLIGITAGAALLGGHIEADHLNAQFAIKEEAWNAQVLAAEKDRDAANNRAASAEQTASATVQGAINDLGRDRAQQVVASAGAAAALARLQDRLGAIGAAAAGSGDRAAALSVSASDACRTGVDQLTAAVNRLAGDGKLATDKSSACIAEKTACERWSYATEALIAALNLRGASTAAP